MKCTKNQIWFYIVFASIIFTKCKGARILTVAPVTSRSHFILANKLSRSLADDGHEVTVISPFGDKYNSTKGSYKSIELTGFMEEFEKQQNDTNFFNHNMMNPFLMIPFFVHMTSEMTENTLRHPKVQNLLKSDEKFDIVLMEQFGFEAGKALAPYFGSHLILYSAIGQNNWVNTYSGTPVLPSYAAEPLFDFVGTMAFYQRLKNTIMRTLLLLVNELYLHPVQNKMVQKYISPEIDFYKAMYNASIIFVNTHISVTPALPRSPNMVFIGGFHLDQPKRLPNDLNQILDSDNGVIFFSMGSVLKSKDLPVERREALLRVFGGLKQTVLWKYEDDTLTNIPDNVKIRKWLPQNDLLAHPNLKLFITHGGYGSTTEAIYYGKPVVALPVFADQYLNSQILQSLGVGQAMPYTDFSEDRFRSIVAEVLSDSKYLVNAKKIAKLYKDRQVKPLDEVLYWVNYVVKHNGAVHLRSVMLDLPWYQLYLLDVLVFYTFVFFGFIFITKTLLKKLRSGFLQFSNKEKLPHRYPDEIANVREESKSENLLAGGPSQDRRRSSSSSHSVGPPTPSSMDTPSPVAVAEHLIAPKSISAVVTEPMPSPATDVSQFQPPLVDETVSSTTPEVSEDHKEGELEEDIFSRHSADINELQLPAEPAYTYVEGPKTTSEFLRESGRFVKRRTQEIESKLQKLKNEKEKLAKRIRDLQGDSIKIDAQIQKLENEEETLKKFQKGSDYFEFNFYSIVCIFLLFIFYNIITCFY